MAPVPSRPRMPNGLGSGPAVSWPPYYPRYYGYYEKAIGIYTHVSDQDAVFSTQVISCSPREALYVLDGLLNNNTIFQIREHTTDTHGYTEIVFALCHLLGFYFMPRIRRPEGSTALPGGPLVQGGDQSGTHYQDPIHLTLSDRSGPTTDGATPAQQRRVSP